MFNPIPIDDPPNARHLHPLHCDDSVHLGLGHGKRLSKHVLINRHRHHDHNHNSNNSIDNNNDNNQ